MADDNCMNELEATIQSINTALKKFMQNKELSHIEYLRLRSGNLSRMDQIEAKLVALQVNSASNGGSNSSPQSLIAETPYTTDDLTSPKELNEAFPVLDAFNLCSDIEPLIVDLDMHIVLKGPPSSVMERDGCSEKEATLVMDINRHGSSVLSNPKVCDLIVVQRQLDILLSDPPDLVPAPPPPPLAPPWLHHLIYAGPVDLPPLTIENNTHNSSQLDHEEFSCGYFFSSAFELSIVALDLAKLVDNVMV
ncbi:hypothetical protein TSUD_391690 [Trifolium subterraneum]|uniref:Uncharacterized protein n=1 Tax=Trifolium subterraneum TaxID=3900 RepID=A0A2Z6NL46_TRISU|nr:hypothetical protein TSUD_391690 [Trifolium subterraneum]